MAGVLIFNGSRSNPPQVVLSAGFTEEAGRWMVCFNTTVTNSSERHLGLENVMMYDSIVESLPLELVVQAVEYLDLESFVRSKRVPIDQS